MKKVLLSSALSLLVVAGIGTNNVLAQSTEETPTNIEIINDAGVLELIETPAAFNVLSSAISTGKQTLTPEETLSITLSDFRPASNGWTLTSQLSGFTLAESSVVTLPEASIAFSNLSASTMNASVDATAPTVSPVTLVSGGDSAVIASADRTIVDNAGLGPWNIVGDTSINIPAFSSSVGTHNATITWTLADAY